MREEYEKNQRGRSKRHDWVVSFSDLIPKLTPLHQEGSIDNGHLLTPIHLADEMKTKVRHDQMGQTRRIA